MPAALAQLPDDIDALKRLIIERDAQIAAKHAELQVERNEVIAARLMIEN
jgi:hypothetical protein